MNITFENIGCLKKGELEIREHALNIKYGCNGIGKSTISKAILAKLTGDSVKLSELSPFENRQAVVSIMLPPEVKKCACFDIGYLERVKTSSPYKTNTFEILIENKDLLAVKEELSTLLSGLSVQLQSPEIQEFLQSADAIASCVNEKGFKGNKAETRALSPSKNGIAKKDYSSNENLGVFQPLFDSENFHLWFKWRNDGKLYQTESFCPYCGQPLPPTIDKINEDFAKEGNSKELGDIVSARSFLSKAGSILFDGDSSVISSIMCQKSAPKKGDKSFDAFVASVNRVSDEVCKIRELQNITSAYKKIDNLAEFCKKLSCLKLHDNVVNSERKNWIEKFAAINKGIDDLVSKADQYIKNNNIYNSKVAEAIKANEDSFNEFLKYAAIPYVFSIEQEGSRFKTKLTSKDGNYNIDNPSTYFSYGEMNSFAVIMFAAECIAKDVDLIILDDPISSYDMGKRYLLLNFVFGKGKGSAFSLKDKTCLLFTHDFTPVIDIRKLSLPSFGNKAAWYVTSENGIWKEEQIKSEDILLSTQYELSAAQALETPTVVRLFHLRRYIELTSETEKSHLYDYISSLIHLKQCPDHKNEDRSFSLLDNADINRCDKEFSELCNTVLQTYNDILNEINNLSYLINQYEGSNNKYDKLAIFRMINRFVQNNEQLRGHFPLNGVLKAIVDDTAHIEHQYIFTLKSISSDQISDYVIELCNTILDRLKERVN